MSRLRLFLLGRFQLTLDDEPVASITSPKIHSLLAYLALEAHQPHSREALAELLWPGRPAGNASQNLRQSLSRLQRAIPESAGVPVLSITRQTLQLNPSSDIWIDATAFIEALEGTQRHSHTVLERCRNCCQALAEATALYRGDFLEDVVSDSAEFDEWALLRREWLRREALDALYHLAEHHLWLGNYDAAYQAAWRQVEMDLWREEAHRQVMRALVSSGRRSEALDQFDSLRRILAEELEVQPAEETARLYEQIRDGIMSGMTVRESKPRPNLPRQFTPFIGRDEELAQIDERLDDPSCALLTIVGPGGVGKTRLAIQTALEKADEFDEGVFFVPLASVASAEFLVTAVADALNITFPAGLQRDAARQEHVLVYLRRKQMLIVLDNYEHLIPATDLLVDILQQAPQVKLLVTSRQPLHLRAEWLLDVKGLSYPREQTVDISQVAAYGAVQLFTQSAQRLQADFALSPETAPGVGRICQLVGGMPLALELAAAWIRVHDCVEIATEISQSLDFLATTMGDVPARHRSLRAVFDRSWALLSEAEREVLPKLAVFRGGFTAEAAGNVAGASADVLAELANKSLVRRSGDDRYNLHETLRQYAGDKLAGVPDAARIAWDRHAIYYASLVQSQELGLTGRHAAQALAVLRRDLDNIRAAWRRAVDQVQLDPLQRAGDGLTNFYELATLYEEGEQALTRAVAQLSELGEAAELSLLDMLAKQAHFFNLCARYDEALAAAQKAVQLAEKHQAIRESARAYLYWGEALLFKGHFDAAQPYLEQALSRARSLGQPQVVASSLFALCSYLEHKGDVPQAQANIEEALDIYMELDDAWGQARILRKLGAMAGHVGNYERARAYYRQAQPLFQQLGDKQGESGVYNNWGAALLDQGSYAEAVDLLQRALDLRQEIGDRKGASITLINLGSTAGMQGDFVAAQSFFEQSLATMREIGNKRGESSVLNFLGYALLCQHKVDDAEAVLEQALQATQAIGNVAFAGLARYRQGQIAQMCGDYHAARLAFEEALRVARETSFSFLKLDVLADLGPLYQQMGDESAALATSAEAVEAAQQYNRPPAIAYAYTRRGDVFALQEQWSAAEEAYRKALDLHTSLGQPFFGVESLTGLAQATWAQGDLAQAQKYVDQILVYVETYKLQGTLRPFPIYLTCYRVLRAKQDEQARMILARAYASLQEMAAKIQDPHLRRSFGEDVAAHREIMSEFAKRRSTGPS